jgi:uncharacterized protein (DUF885 family)
VSAAPAVRRLLAVTAAAALAGAATALPSADERVKALADRKSAQQAGSARLLSGPDLPDYPDIGEAAFLRRVGEARADLQALDKIPLSQLSEDARLTYDILREDALAVDGGAPFYWLDFQIVPYRANEDFNYLRWLFANYPLGAADERKRYLHLLREYRDLLSQHLEKLRGQEQRGLRLSKPGIGSALDLLNGLDASLGLNLRISPERAAKLPAEASAFPDEVERTVESEVRPQLKALIAYLSGAYRDAAPDAVTISQYPRGREYYRHLARRSTTLDLTPKQLHKLGLKRMAELETRIRTAAAKTGLKGTLPEIYGALRRDPRFTASSADSVGSYYMSQLKLIEPKLPLYFSRLPQAGYGVRRLPPENEKGSTFGYYAAPSPPHEPRGLYIYNGSEVQKRSLLNAQAVIYHELMPGHHLQSGLQLENEKLHPLRKSYWVNGYGEGWAEYASSLGYEMGIYDDPRSNIGRTVLEMFLTSRLVVDTGLSHYGWSLEQARDYMRQRVYLSDSEIESETLRYATFPGQALSYRTGFEKMWELRHRAECALGPKFDIRRFHDAVLDGGNLPLRSLDWKIDRWIGREAAGRGKNAGARSCPRPR